MLQHREQGLRRGSGDRRGRRARDSLGQGFCLGEDFTKYVGIESGKTSYQVEYLTPGEGTWAQGDRKITCVVTQGDKSQVKGSAKNSKK